MRLNGFRGISFEKGGEQQNCFWRDLIFNREKFFKSYRHGKKLEQSGGKPK